MEYISIKRFAYVEFVDKESVENALKLDDTPFKGRQLKVRRLFKVLIYRKVIYSCWYVLIFSCRFSRNAAMFHRQEEAEVAAAADASEVSYFTFY